MPATYKKVNTETREVNKLQDNLIQFITPFVNSAIVDGVLLRNISLTTGIPNLIDHRLSRKPLGWIVVRQRAQSQVWDEQDLNNLPTTTLDLRCSANVVVDLWIF